MIAGEELLYDYGLGRLESDYLTSAGQELMSDYGLGRPGFSIKAEEHQCSLDSACTCQCMCSQPRVGSCMHSNVVFAFFGPSACASAHECMRASATVFTLLTDVCTVFTLLTDVCPSSAELWVCA